MNCGTMITIMNWSTKCQTVEWLAKGKKQSHKERATCSKLKTKLITFFNARGIINKEFLPASLTVNKEFYKKKNLERWLKHI